MDAELPYLGPELITQGLGRFDVLELIGTGRFGETYRAVRSGEEFALKVCHFLPVMPEYLWEREVASLRRVVHANVMAFRDAGCIRVRGRDYPYMECEYVGGGDVGRRIEAGERPQTASDLRGLLAGLLRGIRELHDLGILHRDIRPSNVVLRGGEWPRPVLLDFGLAHAFCHSPAHQRLSLASRRPDLRAIAAVVYEAGTGVDPSSAGSSAPGNLRGNHRRRQQLADPRRLAVTFEDDVTGLLLQLLSSRHRMDAADALEQLGES